MKNLMLKNILQKYSRKISKDIFYVFCDELQKTLDSLLKIYPFESLQHAREVTESPENLIIPWDIVDQDIQKETLSILSKANQDAQKLLKNLQNLYNFYTTYEILDENLPSILEQNYTALATVMYWGQ